MGDGVEEGTSPMGAQDIALSDQYQAEADRLHAQAAAEENVATVLDVWGLGADEHAMAKEDRKQGDLADDRSWQYADAADLRDAAANDENERHDATQQADLAAVRASQAGGSPAHPGMNEHQVTERGLARAEETYLRERASALQRDEDQANKDAADEERLAREGPPIAPDTTPPSGAATPTSEPTQGGG